MMRGASGHDPAGGSALIGCAVCGETVLYQLVPEPRCWEHLDAAELELMRDVSGVVSLRAMKKVKAERDRLRAENERLRAALAMFADETSWIVGDGGAEWNAPRMSEPWTIAREALAREEETDGECELEGTGRVAVRPDADR